MVTNGHLEAISLNLAASDKLLYTLGLRCEAAGV
jgi:hypothetical protein